MRYKPFGHSWQGEGSAGLGESNLGVASPMNFCGSYRNLIQHDTAINRDPAPYVNTTLALVAHQNQVVFLWPVTIWSSTGGEYDMDIAMIFIHGIMLRNIFRIKVWHGACCCAMCSQGCHKSIEGSPTFQFFHWMPIRWIAILSLYHPLWITWLLCLILVGWTIALAVYVPHTSCFDTVLMQLVSSLLESSWVLPLAKVTQRPFGEWFTVENPSSLLSKRALISESVGCHSWGKRQCFRLMGWTSVILTAC